MSDLVSYIIPCYNSHETIADCLTSIINQNINATTEIIIVDSSDNVYTKEIVENYHNFNIKYLHNKRRLFAGQARNLGIIKSSGNYLALIDSDIILPEDWTNVMLSHCNKIKSKKSLKVIMSGTIKNAAKTRSYLKDSLLLMLSNKYLQSKNIEYRKYLPGCNLFFEKELKKKIVFPDVVSGEDILITKKMHSENVLLALIGPNVVEHLTLKTLHQYSFELGTSSYMLSIRGRKSEKLLLPFKLLFGSVYRLFKIVYNVIAFRFDRLFKLLIFLPGIIIGSFFFHLGILYGLVKSNTSVKP